MNLPAGWAWLQANSVPILSGIYFATMGCVLLLAICVFALARQHAKLARCFNAKIAALEPQLRSADERLDILIAMMARAAAAKGGAIAEKQKPGEAAEATAPLELVPAAILEPAWKPSAAVRGELERLMAEFGADQAQTAAEPSPIAIPEPARDAGSAESLMPERAEALSAE